jgi:hypothetical protein
MAHYAFLDENNIVTEVIVGIDETELIESQPTETWYENFRGQTCKRTSYNTQGGQHLYGGTPFRKNYAGIGFTYDSVRDAFIPPKPYPSWILNEDTCYWEAPIPYPNVDHIPEYLQIYNHFYWAGEEPDITGSWIPWKSFDSWELVTHTSGSYYDAPTEYPISGSYDWDEDTLSWISI